MFFKSHNESGRSMVEMLGVLAIVGVLSIGSIAGYSYGMDKYRANQTINDLMLMGIDVITQNNQNREPDLSEWGTKTSMDYPFSVIQNPINTKQYGIQIENVPSRICKMVGDALKPTAIIYVGDDSLDGTQDPCDSTEQNTMEFYFATGMGDGTCTQTCTQCQECSNGRCINKINGDTCIGGVCNNGVCINNTDEPYSLKFCTSDNDCGECEFCSEYGSCNVSNAPCDDGRGVCRSRGGNQAICVINKTCETNRDCDEFGKDYFCGFTSRDYSYDPSGAYLCTKLDFVQKYFNGYTVYISRRTNMQQYGEPYDTPSAQNACARMGMKLVPNTIFCNIATEGLEMNMCEGWHTICSNEEVSLETTTASQ